MTYEPTTQRTKRTRDRVVIDGRDVTHFRNAGATDLSYELTEPYGYGPGSVTFPDITFLEEHLFGQPGQLAWVRDGARARIDRVDVDTHVVVERGVWRGRAFTQRPRNDGLTVELTGDASGPLSVKWRPQPLVRKVRDAGWWVARAFREAGLDFRPFFGPETGTPLSNGEGGMYQLGWVDSCVERAFDGGDPWTVMPTPNGRAYEMRRKDLTTVNCTVWADAFGVDIDVVDDVTEKAQAGYGAGQSEDGAMWVNAVTPDMGPEEVPAFPGAMTIGSTGEGVFSLKTELNANGLLRTQYLGGDYNEGTAEAVETVQERAGLPVTGDVDLATWKAVWGDTLSDQRIDSMHIRPLVIRPKVEKFLYTANGSVVGHNPDYDEDKLRVDRHIDFGITDKDVARKWWRRELVRVNNGPNYYGTITLDADVWEGDHAHGTAGTVLEKEAIKPGWNIKVKKPGRDILFHIAKVARKGNQVVLDVDTKARDYLDIGEMLARDEEARRDYSRNWRQSHKASRQQHDALVGWYAEDGAGILRQTIKCPANKWTGFWIIGGGEGQVMRTTIKTTNSPAAFVFAASGRQYAIEALQRRVPDAWLVDADGEPVWSDPDLQEWLHEQAGIQYIIGDADQPGGYWPKKHTNRNGVVTSHPVTGEHRDYMTWPYVTYGKPVIWCAIFPDRDTVLKPQELFRASRTLGG